MSGVALALKSFVVGLQYYTPNRARSVAQCLLEQPRFPQNSAKDLSVISHYNIVLLT